MRQLRSDVDAAVAAGRNGPLLVQRLRSVLQDERAKSAAHQAQAQTGKCKSSFFLHYYYLPFHLSTIVRYGNEAAHTHVNCYRTQLRMFF